MSPKTTQLHALLFTTPGGLDALSIRDICKLSEAELEQSKAELMGFLAGSGIELIEHNNQLQLGARASALPSHDTDKKVTSSLSTAGLEVLAIIAYKQPISRAEIEELRGIGAQQSLRGLLEKELIDEKKTKIDGITHLQYVTTSQFLHYMGLKTITDLPKLKEQS